MFAHLLEYRVTLLPISELVKILFNNIQLQQ